MMPSVAGASLRTIIQIHNNQEKRVRAMVPVFAKNPTFEHMLYKFNLLAERIETWAVEEEHNPERNRVILERTVGLLGKSATRNLAACIRLLRVQNGLPKKENDKFMLGPQDQLKYAIAAEELCQAGDMAFSEYAYEAGLHYDWLRAVLVYKKASKDTQGYLEKLWPEAIKTAKIAYALSTQMKSFELNHYVFGSALLMHLGKVLLSALYPKEMGEKSYAAFLTEVDKMKDKKYFAYHLLEKRRFAITHAELSSLYVVNMGLFGPAEKGICYYQNPNYIEAIDKKSFVLATVLSVAESLAATDKLVLTHVQKKCLERIQISEEAVAAAFKKATGK